MATTSSAPDLALSTDQVIAWLNRIRDFVASSPESKAWAQRAIELIQERDELSDTLVAIVASGQAPQLR